MNEGDTAKSFETIEDVLSYRKEIVRKLSSYFRQFLHRLSGIQNKIRVIPIIFIFIYSFIDHPTYSLIIDKRQRHTSTKDVHKTSLVL